MLGHPRRSGEAVRYRAMTRVFSGIQPTGEQHLGNFLGATRNWAKMQHETDAFRVVDLHAITIRHDDRAAVRDGSVRLAQMLMAVGLDPEVCTLFVQSTFVSTPNSAGSCSAMCRTANSAA